MSTIRKQGQSWRADIKKNGVRKSASFTTKRAAQEWAAKIESEIVAQKFGNYPRKTFAEALDKYAQEVSTKKQGSSKEIVRIQFIKREFPNLVNKVLSEIKPADMAEWRDKRLNDVTLGTVQRDINLLGNVFTIARKEWGWCGESPFLNIKKPGHNPPRTRRILPQEVKAICRQLGYITGDVKTLHQETALAFLIGLRTGMRAGEILRINERSLDAASRVITVSHKTEYKTGEKRQIAITKKALRLIGYLTKRGYYFKISGGTLDQYFRGAKGQLNIEDLHFHDTRAEALTRLARKVDVMTLAKISGHKDLKILFETYYRESAADIAARLL